MVEVIAACGASTSYSIQASRTFTSLDSFNNMFIENIENNCWCVIISGTLCLFIFVTLLMQKTTFSFNNMTLCAMVYYSLSENLVCDDVFDFFLQGDGGSCV